MGSFLYGDVSVMNSPYTKTMYRPVICFQFTISVEEGECVLWVQLGRLIRLDRCSGWSESWQGEHVTLFVETAPGLVISQTINTSHII